MKCRNIKSIGWRMQSFIEGVNIRFVMFVVSFGLLQRLFDAHGVILPMSRFSLLNMLKRVG